MATQRYINHEFPAICLENYTTGNYTAGNMMLTSGLLLASAALASALPHHALFARVVDSAVASSTEYDFVVAGGGTAGLTVADRLTENPNGTWCALTESSVLC